MFGDKIQEAGFTINRIGSSIGAVIGTEYHKKAAAVLRARMAGVTDFGALLAEAVATGIEYPEDGGIIWDATTKDEAAAQLALEKIIRAWLPLGMSYTPAQVEQELTKDLGDGFELSGHIDVRTADGAIRDHKSGANDPKAYEQMGAYSILAEHKLGPVSALHVDWMKRVGVKTPASAPVTLTYDKADCVSAANRILETIQEDYLAFKKTGDPHEFRANPRTMMCSEKYCSVKGTPFCKLGG